jgi:hypothetical protein
VVQDHSAQRRSPDPFGILPYWMTSPLTAVSMAENSSAPEKVFRVIIAGGTGRLISFSRKKDDHTYLPTSGAARRQRPCRFRIVLPFVGVRVMG